MNINNVKDKIEELGQLPLECDGFTRVFEYFLTNNDIRHQCYGGTIKYKEKEFAPHYWIVTDMYVIDFSIQRWFGKESPNGILQIEEIRKFGNKTIIKIKDHELEYDGNPMSFGAIKLIYEILTRELK